MHHVSLILAMDESGAIGLDSALPWRSPLDMSFFADTTRRGASGQSILLIGSKTASSLPPMRGRKLVVLTRDTQRTPRTQDYNELSTLPDVSYADEASAVRLVGIANSSNFPVFAAGGAQIYKWALWTFTIDTYYVTIIPGVHKADTYLDTNTLETLGAIPSWRKFTCANFCVLKSVQFRRAVHWEEPYLDLLYSVLTKGSITAGRNGETMRLFGQTLRFDLREAFPLLTTKRMWLRGIFLELMFFLQGKTDTNWLEERKVNIWKDNTSAEFLAARGLQYKVGEMGPMYGYNWRYFGLPFGEQPQPGKYIDQYARVLSTLSSDPSSRRAHMTTYNPLVADHGVLEPCHGISTVFQADKSGATYVLSCVMTQRSADLICGVPFNIASYALLLHVMCGQLNAICADHTWIPGELVMVLCDAHIYKDHYGIAQRQCLRAPYGSPRLEIPPLSGKQDAVYKSDGSPLEFEDVKLLGYSPHFKLEAKMVA